MSNEEKKKPRKDLPNGLSVDEALEILKTEDPKGEIVPLKSPKEIEAIVSGTDKRDHKLDTATAQVIGFVKATDRTLKGLRQHRATKNKEEREGIDVLIKHLELTRDEGLSYPPYKPQNWYSQRVLMFWGLEQQYPLLEDGQKGKFKRSGHLQDQMLKYNYPKDRQPTLFDILNENTKSQIEKAQVEVKEIVEGIRLSPSEQKVIDSLCKLLHERSQTFKPEEEDYYAGNAGYSLVEYGGEKTPAPKLAFSLYELTKEYKGGEAISGKDVENVKQILTELNSRQFLIRYTETTKGKKGEWIKKEYEAFRRLIDVDKATLSSGVGDIEHYKKTETVILLNPIFQRQINSKFIVYPNDILKRTIIAYGSHNLSEITLRLRDYLTREHSSKRYEPEINMDRLYWMLSEKWMKESRKKKVQEFTDKALETCKALGLLLSFKVKTGSTGEPKIIFKLNKDWE